MLILKMKKNLAFQFNSSPFTLRLYLHKSCSSTYLCPSRENFPRKLSPCDIDYCYKAGDTKMSSSFDLQLFTDMLIKKKKIINKVFHFLCRLASKVFLYVLTAPRRVYQLDDIFPQSQVITVVALIGWWKITKKKVSEEFWGGGGHEHGTRQRPWPYNPFSRRV